MTSLKSDDNADNAIWPPKSCKEHIDSKVLHFIIIIRGKQVCSQYRLIYSHPRVSIQHVFRDLSKQQCSFSVLSD